MGDVERIEEISATLGAILRDVGDPRRALYKISEFVVAREKGLNKIIGGMVLSNHRGEFLVTYSSARHNEISCKLPTGLMASVAPELKVEGIKMRPLPYEGAEGKTDLWFTIRRY